MGIFRIDIAALLACVSNARSIPLNDASGKKLMI